MDSMKFNMYHQLISIIQYFQLDWKMEGYNGIYCLEEEFIIMLISGGA